MLIRGDYRTYGSKIVSYLRRLAIITPYAELRFRFSAEGDAAAGARSRAIRFQRRTENMPPVPQPTKRAAPPRPPHSLCLRPPPSPSSPGRHVFGTHYYPYFVPIITRIAYP